MRKAHDCGYAHRVRRRALTPHGRGGSVSRRDLNQAARNPHPLSGGTKPEETSHPERQPLFGREREGGASLREAASLALLSLNYSSGGESLYRIFVVEDDGTIARMVRTGLEQWGYTVRCAENFDRVDQDFAEFDPQLVLLDISLPRYNGYHWCSEIRRASKVPVVFLSSAADNMNIVMAMNMGGDDFIAKPFDMNVLVAKVQAILRRTYDFGAPAHLLPCAGGMLNPESSMLHLNGEDISLTRNELRIVQLLLEHRGQIVSRGDLMTRLWESDSFVDENTLTVNIARLRKKLEDAGVHELIRTKKGEGYWLAAD